MALIHTTAGYYEGLKVHELERIILWELGQVSGTTVTYDRFPKWLIRNFLNERQNQFVFHSQCIKKFAFLVCKEGYRQYKLPVNCMDAGVIAAKFYFDSDSYEDLILTDFESMDLNDKGWLVSGNSSPEYAFMGNSYGNVPMLEVHPPPDEDGSSYALAPETGIVVDDDLPAAAANITGMATGGGADTLVDAGVDFTDMGLVNGIYVRNVTDGSYAYISAIAANTITFAANLTGGTADVFAAGDSYNILLGEYGVITDWAADDRVIFGSEVGLLSTITVPAGNIRVDYVPYPAKFNSDPLLTDANQGNDDQYPEIPKMYHRALAMGVVADLLGTFHEGSKEFQRANFYEQKFGVAVGTAKSKKDSRPFVEKQVQLVPRLR